ncbi:MAG: RluA family pseudouridine synthase [Ruminococcaceae bacterium]|nr:RluA family pseudouridine synthase [Oscillospiraceae bacterium]
MRIEINDAFAGKTLKQLLQLELRFSTKMIKYLKYRPDGMTVNGKRKTVRYVLQKGDLLELATEDAEASPKLRAVKLPLEILYEDDDLVVPVKPANMPTHPSHDHYDDTVANALAYRYERDGIPFVFRPINRLDRNTSGLLLIARHKAAAGILTKAMQQGRIQKKYLAILDGEMPPTEQGRIDACLHRTAKSIIVREVCSPDAPDADPSVTEYRVLAAMNGHTLVEAAPITGRTHQLRVHFSYLGYPITGDDLYGAPSKAIDRHALHARSLSFPLPSTDEEITLTAPLTEDFAKLLEAYFPDHPLLTERILSL